MIVKDSFGDNYYTEVEAVAPKKVSNETTKKEVDNLPDVALVDVNLVDVNQPQQQKNVENKPKLWYENTKTLSFITILFFGLLILTKNKQKNGK